MCTYMLVISFMVLVALEFRAFCLCIRSLWAERQIVESTMICMYPKESLLFGKMQQGTHLVVGFFCSELGFLYGFWMGMFMMLPGWSHRVESKDMGRGS
jgi:hypothetical protein